VRGGSPPLGRRAGVEDPDPFVAIDLRHVRMAVQDGVAAREAVGQSPFPAHPRAGHVRHPDARACGLDHEPARQEVSYRRRLLHGKIDILRAELVARLQKSGGKSVLDQVDVDSLTAILASKAPPPSDA